MSKVSPSIAVLLGEASLKEVSHATVELKLTGTSAEVQRAVKHIAGKKGRAKLVKMAKKEVKEPEPEPDVAEDGSGPEERGPQDENTPQAFANRLLDGDDS